MAVSTTPTVSGVQSTLSEWAGPYVTDMLGKSWALSESPYQAYQGPLTAGLTDNQTNAFSGIGALATDPNQNYGEYTSPDMYTAGDITTDTWNNQFATQYMNPYLQSALNPMLEEARREAQITRVNDATRLSKAGAFGGSRQAIMESELNRNLMDKQNQMLTKGYFDAYNTANQAFNKDQSRGLEALIANERAQQVQGEQGLRDAENEAKFGLSSLQAQQDVYDQMLKAGEIERGANQEAVAADYAQWQQERDYPFEMLRFQQSMLDGMPIASRDTNYNDLTMLQEILGTGGSLGELFEQIFG